jgi:hypothetical protein
MTNDWINADWFKKWMELALVHDYKKPTGKWILYYKDNKLIYEYTQ